MSVIAVVSSPPTEVVDTPLDRLVQARKSVLINRFRFASELFEKLQMQRQSPLSMTTHSCDVAVQAEFLVVSNFVKHSEFLDILVGDARSTCPRIAASFLSTWILFEFMLTTIRNFGHCSRRLFFLDESYLDLTEAAVSAYYATDANLLDPWHAGRIGVSTFVDTLEVSAKLARSRLDDVESTVLTFILFIRSADLHGVDSAHLSAMLNEVFRNLAMHYQQSYEDYALRLDVIVHMADEILRIRRLFDEHNIILRLYGRATMKSRIEDSVRQGKSLPVEEID